MNLRKALDARSKFDRDYFENGIETGVSAYENYRWMPERSLREAMSIIKNVNFNSVLDFGCAKGFLVKALRMLGKEAYGIDISDYAIKTAESNVREYVSTRTLASFKESEFDLVVSKDTLEHVAIQDLTKILSEIRRIAKQILIAVPLGENGKYRIREYELDRTHIIRENEDFWITSLISAGFSIDYCDYKLGYLKRNWTSQNEYGNMFLIGR